MNESKLIVLLVLILVTLTVTLLMITLLLKRFKSKFDEDGKLKISYGIWFAALFAGAGNILSSVILISSEAIDNLSKLSISNTVTERIKVLTTVFGIGLMWYLLWFFAIKFVFKFAFPTRKEEEEMELDSAGYFLIRASAFLGIIFAFSPVLEMIMKLFVPGIEIPFYH